MLVDYIEDVRVDGKNTDTWPDITFTDIREDLSGYQYITVSVYKFTHAGGQSGELVVFHDEGRAAICFGGDSIWGDWDEDTKMIRTDDGGHHYDTGGCFWEDDEE